MAVTERDLFLAILAMDSYNRGYGAGLNDAGAGDTNGLGEAGSRIGNATVKAFELAQGSEAAGFYAVAYQTQWGTVISYRGTDFTRDGDLARNTRTATLGPDLGAGRGRRRTAGWALRQRVCAVYGSTPPTAVLQADVSKAPARGGGRAMPLVARTNGATNGIPGGLRP